MPKAAADTAKAQLRAAAIARRDALSDAQRATAAMALSKRGLPIAIAPDAVVAAYSPLRSEFDPRLLMMRLAAQHIELALPVVKARGEALTFRRWHLGESLVRGAFGIMEPATDMDELVPDVLLVPLAAFDRTGHRIGYGAGFYDRTLEQLRAQKPVVAIGLAFSVQEVDAVASLDHDQRLDFILTEHETIDFRSL
jgi:5-formyltetrahydrofolate cyclo-ligase